MQCHLTWERQIVILMWVLAAAAPSMPDPLVDAIARCLPVAEASARLTCLDAAGRALVAGIDRHEISVVRREDVRRARRNLFGIAGDPGDALPGATAERIDALDTSVVAAVRRGNDRWTLRLAEGGRWETTDAWIVGRDPKPGTTVSIRRGSLGSYVMKAGSERAVRVRRIN